MLAARTARIARLMGITCPATVVPVVVPAWLYAAYLALRCRQITIDEWCELTTGIEIEEHTR